MQTKTNELRPGRRARMGKGEGVSLGRLGALRSLSLGFRLFTREFKRLHGVTELDAT